MRDVDLSLVSMDNLINEINKRFDFWIFSGMQIRDQDSKIVTLREWRGNSATCAGLASQLQIVIADQYFNNEKNGDDTVFEL